MFRFGDVGGCDMKVLDLQLGKRVLWEVIDDATEWIGTTVSFDLTHDGEWTIVLFAHAGWREPVEFMNDCSTKRAIFLMSLKSLVETGQGRPAPRRRPDQQLGLIQPGCEQSHNTSPRGTGGRPL